jgi:hypothetical protein
MVFAVDVVGDHEHQVLRQRRQLAGGYRNRSRWDACMASIARPAAQGRITALFEQGFHKPGDAEDRLGFYVGRLAR